MHLLTDFRRIVKSGFLNFWRNGAVSLASVLVFTMTLFIIGSLFFGNAVVNSSLEQAREQVDITIYFKLDAFRDDMSRFEDSIQALPEVKSTTFTSRDDALAQFIEDHKNDQLILQSLEELDGENPLRAELTIKAHDPSQYVSIVNFLENKNVILGVGDTNIIDEINYEDNKEAIERFRSFIDSVERAGFYLSIVSAIIAVLVAFTTITLAIYVAREEVSVMRLVGAGNNYIRGPFITEGVMYGVLATFFTLAIFYPVTKWASQATNNFFGAIDLFEYYISNLPLVFVILLVSGVGLGVISSLLALRRYLKV